jgi:hypothetical protein
MHIDIRKHFAHEVIRNGADQGINQADFVTKGLHMPQFLV